VDTTRQGSPRRGVGPVSRVRGGRTAEEREEVVERLFSDRNRTRAFMAREYISAAVQPTLVLILLHKPTPRCYFVIYYLVYKAGQGRDKREKGEIRERRGGNRNQTEDRGRPYRERFVRG
jgi:hypothetical protein